MENLTVIHKRDSVLPVEHPTEKNLSSIAAKETNMRQGFVNVTVCTVLNHNHNHTKHNVNIVLQYIEAFWRRILRVNGVKWAIYEHTFWECGTVP